MAGWIPDGIGVGLLGVGPAITSCGKFRNTILENRSTANNGPKSLGSCKSISSASGTILLKACNIISGPKPPRDCKCYCTLMLK